MPAYFSLNIVFNRRDIYHNFMNDFYNHLFSCGLKFKSGYYDDKNLSLAEIINFNQNKLENNFHLGFSEHCSNNYKQLLFDFCNFTEVRGFLLNNYPSDDEFTFSVIVPEDDIIEDYSTDPLTVNEKMNNLKVLAECIWNFEFVQSIQTHYEISEGITASLLEIKNGDIPCVEPFSIIPEEYVTKSHTTDFTHFPISRNGVLLQSKPPSVSNPIFGFFRYLF